MQAQRVGPHRMDREHAMSIQTARRLAWISVWLAGALVAAGLILSMLAFVASNGLIHLEPHRIFHPLITLTFSIVGALVASRHPRNPIGWILLATGVRGELDLLSLRYYLYSDTLSAGGPLPGVGLARWLDAWIWLIPVTMPLTFLLLLFPDGRLLSPRWRPVAWLAGAGLAAAIIGFALD